MPLKKRRPFIWSIHGINTHAHWQKTFANEVALRDAFRPFAVDYQKYSVLKFLWGRSRSKMITLFRDEYFANMERIEPDLRKRTIYRPSIVAHSFGSYIVGECMTKHEDVVFDKILLCGSILPRDFDWGKLLQRNQVWKVRNEYGSLDKWSKLAGNVSATMGDSGAEGFSFESPSLIQYKFPLHGHSDYFSKGHMENFWFKFFSEPSLQYGIVHGGDIVQDDVFSAYLRQCRAIDKKVYSGLPNYSSVELPEGLSNQWIRKNPDIYTFLINQELNQVIGYVNALPVDNTLYDLILSGRANDNDVTANQIGSYSRGEEVKLYLMSINIEPGARLIKDGRFQLPFERLCYAVVEKLLRHAQRRVRVVSILATGWTEDGRDLCRMFGMEEKSQDPFGNPIYELSLTTNIAGARNKYFYGIRKLMREYETNHSP